MYERNDNITISTRPYLSIKDKFCILEKKSRNMQDMVQECTSEVGMISQNVTQLVNVIDSTPTMFYNNCVDEIKNKENQISKTTAHQNSENSR